jgi:hypothetical protein
MANMAKCLNPNLLKQRISHLVNAQMQKRNPIKWIPFLWLKPNVAG